MANPITVNELLRRNKAVAAKHSPLPTFAELREKKIDIPHIILHLRCNPHYFLGLEPNEGIITIRNACGHVDQALPNILALDDLVGVSDVMIVHHTDCGALQFTDAGIRANLKKRLPDNKEIDSMTFGSITDLEQSVKDDLAFLKASPFIRKELSERSVGFIYNLKTGELNSVEG